MSLKDPRDIIAETPMSRMQIVAVTICIMLNALDGFDVLAITFAAPGIKEQWSVAPGALGIVISAGLIGMAAGSLVIAPIADVIGRRMIILGCIVVMAGGMFVSAFSTSVEMLSAFRLITGLGIGGMLAAINAMTAEYANAKNKDLAVGVMTIGYPIGGVIGGSIAVWLLGRYEWQSVFLFGAAVTAVMFPIVVAALPESIEFLVAKHGAHALEKINVTLKRMRHETIDALPERHEADKGGKLSDIFSSRLIRRTVLVTSSYFLHIMTFYYIVGWVPSIVASLGFDKATSSSVSVIVNLGGIIGGVTLGYAARRIQLKYLVTGVMIATALSLAVFGRTSPDLTSLKIVGFVVGFFVFSGIVGLYAFMARVFPTHVRSTGTGFVIGVGRGGGALGPIIAGYLIAVGVDRPGVAALMALGSALGAVAIFFLREEGSEKLAPATS